MYGGHLCNLTPIRKNMARRRRHPRFLLHTRERTHEHLSHSHRMNPNLIRMHAQHVCVRVCVCIFGAHVCRNVENALARI